MNKKILSIDELGKKSAEMKRKGKKVALCHGVFDLLHTGHLRHFKGAKKKADCLIVTITADEYVNKGPGRPVFKEDLRSEMLSALECVDYVGINYAITAINLIDTIKPSYYVKGSDYKVASDDVTGNIVPEQKAVEAHGGEIYFTDDITFSSSNLLNEYFDVFPEETKRYLRELKKTKSGEDIIKKIRSFSNCNVLVFGDAIIDEYHYTAPLGQTGKGNILAVQYKSEEGFAGGSIATANHVAGLAGKVTLATILGSSDSRESFIRSKLAQNINPKFFYADDAQTVVKRRFVDMDMAKLFEVYFFKDEPIQNKLDKEICSWLNMNIDSFDIVLVPDFGNGMISESMIKILCKKSKFLAVNTQVNSGNRGYHAINRYPRADFISLNEPELRLASHNKHAPLEKVALQVAKRAKAKYIAITRGTKGAIMIDIAKNKSYHVPALSTKVVDRIGAGDTFLSFAGVCLGNNVPPEIATFVASAAAALNVQTVCNREPVNPVILAKYINTLLK